MSSLHTANSSWNVGRASGRCAACQAELPPNTPCWAALCDGTPVKKELPPAPAKSAKPETPAPLPFVRIDFCESCWSAGRRPEQLAPETLDLAGPPIMFSFWKTTVPVPQQKKKLLVDDSVLMDVFQRMDGKTEPQEVRFRFVLALILMRKRLLKYEGMEESPAPTDATATAAGDKPEIWRMLPRGENATPVHVINPRLTAEQISEVSGQLSAILAEEV